MPVFFFCLCRSWKCQVGTIKRTDFHQHNLPLVALLLSLPVSPLVLVPTHHQLLFAGIPFYDFYHNSFTCSRLVYVYFIFLLLFTFNAFISAPASLLSLYIPAFIIYFYFCNQLFQWLHVMHFLSDLISTPVTPRAVNIPSELQMGVTKQASQWKLIHLETHVYLGFCIYTNCLFCAVM